MNYAKWQMKQKREEKTRTETEKIQSEPQTERIFRPNCIALLKMPGPNANVNSFAMKHQISRATVMHKS